MAQARLKIVEKTPPISERLHQAFPEIDFEKIAQKGGYNEHNLQEKWDALVRQVEWWTEF